MTSEPCLTKTISGDKYSLRRYSYAFEGFPLLVLEPAVPSPFSDTSCTRPNSAFVAFRGTTNWTDFMHSDLPLEGLHGKILLCCFSKKGLKVAI